MVDVPSSLVSLLLITHNYLLSMSSCMSNWLSNICFTLLQKNIYRGGQKQFSEVGGPNASDLSSRLIVALRRRAGDRLG